MQKKETEKSDDFILQTKPFVLFSVLLPNKHQNIHLATHQLEVDTHLYTVIQS